MGLGDAIDSAVGTAAQRANRFRKGRVTAVDTTVSPDRFTVDGARTMTSIASGLIVGDVVVWVDQPDPFILGQFVDT